jgi:integrase/recombinase XerC
VIEDFLTDLRARNYSPQTLLAYSKTLQAAQVALDPTPLIDARPADLRRFFATQAQNTATTKLRHIAAIKTFAKFVRRDQPAAPLIKTAATLQGPRRPRHLPKALSTDQTEALISLASRPAPEREAWKVARDRAIILLLYGAGLRSAEALSLPAAVDVDADAIRVMGKGRRERIVPLLPVVAQAVNIYRRLRSPEKFLFEGFSDRDLRRLMQRLREALGLPSTASPHSLRHSFATHIYQNGGDIRVLADLLGHASVSTTAIYMATDEATLLAVVQRCAPERYGKAAAEKAA